MISLFRLLLGIAVIWLVCRVFYKLGQKKTSRQNRPAADNKRKKVDSSVVDKKQDS